MTTTPSPDRLTWFELSALKAGAVVAFGCNFDVRTVNGMVGIGLGMPCKIEENGLNEIWSAIIVRPLERIADELVYSQDDLNGCIHIDGPEPGGHGDDADPRWGALSPFCLHTEAKSPWDDPAVHNMLDVADEAAAKRPPRKTARFWTLAGSSAAMLKLREGQTLTWSEGGETDEGFSVTGHSWEFRDGGIYYSSHTNACDCDGPISYGSTLFCRLDELKEVDYDGIRFPKWRQTDRWQRDVNAEAAGY